MSSAENLNEQTMNLSIKSTQQTSQVNIRDLQRRFRSKKEMYDFLVQDCMAFMPKLEAATIFFMKQITKAEKDVSVSGFLYSTTW
jgi:hypothetical protein